MKQILKRAVFGLSKRIGLVTKLAAFITRHASAHTDMKDTYGYFRKRFIMNGKNQDVNESIRAEIVRRFEPY